MANEGSIVFKELDLGRVLVLFTIVLVLAFVLCKDTGCITMDVPPIEAHIEVEIVASFNCEELDITDYVILQICEEETDTSQCCDVQWEKDCWISFCDECVVLTEECYEEEEEEDDKEN